MNSHRDKSPSLLPLNRPVVIAGNSVLGFPIDDQTRCIHYHNAEDIIAIKFKCCDQYYPCYSCHEECADHRAAQWPRNQRDTKAVLCGSCGNEMTINEYFGSHHQCPKCLASFNPGCANHYHLYFDMV